MGLKQLEKQREQKPEDILYAGWIEGDGLFVQGYEDIEIPKIVV